MAAAPAPHCAPLQRSRRSLRFRLATTSPGGCGLWLVAKAPPAPDGTNAGAVTDLVVTFGDLDPAVPGIAIKQGGTIRLTLPDGFVDTGLPVVGIGGLPGCAPPTVEGCSTAVVLQGWPQSALIPAVSYEDATKTFVLTAPADWMPNGIAAPGPKQVHLIAFGFTNPERPGNHRIDVTIQPDPADPATMTGTGIVRILKNHQATIMPNSQANIPPPFPNTLYQQVAAGDESLTMRFFMWDRDGNPIEGADIVMNGRIGDIVAADGRRIGQVRVSPPPGAADYSIVTDGPSTVAPAFVSGLLTGVLDVRLHTDPDASGQYEVTFRLLNGNSRTHWIAAN